MRAQEYFEGIRETVVEIERSKEMLERLKASEGAKVQRYGEQQGNGNSDAMDRVNRRIEFEQRLQRRINEASEMLDEATMLLYGDDDHGGLAKLKGNPLRRRALHGVLPRDAMEGSCRGHALFGEVVP